MSWLSRSSTIAAARSSTAINDQRRTGMSNPQALRRKLAKASQRHQSEDVLDALLHLSLELLQHTAGAAPRNQLVLIHTAIIGSAATPSDALAESLQPLLDRVSAIADD